MGRRESIVTDDRLNSRDILQRVGVSEERVGSCICVTLAVHRCDCTARALCLFYERELSTLVDGARRDAMTIYVIELSVQRGDICIVSGTRDRSESTEELVRCIIKCASGRTHKTDERAGRFHSESGSAVHTGSREDYYTQSQTYMYWAISHLETPQVHRISMHTKFTGQTSSVDGASFVIHTDCMILTLCEATKDIGESQSEILGLSKEWRVDDIRDKGLYDITLFDRWSRVKIWFDGMIKWRLDGFYKQIVLLVKWRDMGDCISGVTIGGTGKKDDTGIGDGWVHVIVIWDIDVCSTRWEERSVLWRGEVRRRGQKVDILLGCQLDETGQGHGVIKCERGGCVSSRVVSIRIVISPDTEEESSDDRAIQQDTQERLNDLWSSSQLVIRGVIVLCELVCGSRLQLGRSRDKEKRGGVERQLQEQLHRIAHYARGEYSLKDDVISRKWLRYRERVSGDGGERGDVAVKHVVGEGVRVRAESVN
ncbi:hypothetical protein Tco_0751748 [Tanacetum coccineum]|uniref:Uncharacterized protein n=1 Tax=Tanacetum coccineum TaxID=301880 RepID=A0ABQ4Z7R4_9ASTR